MKKLQIKNFHRIIEMMTINNIALSLIGIFIPIYILEIGFTFQDVMIFLITHHVVLLIAAFVAVYISNTVGLVNTLKIRFIFSILFFVLLFNLAEFPGLILWIAIVSGIDGALYWEPVNILMIRNTESKSMGSSLSKFLVFPKFFTIFSSLIGAAIAVHFSFSVLIIIVALILITSILPIIHLQSEKTNFIFSRKKIRDTYVRNKDFFIAEIIDNLAEDAIVIWTIFIYLELISVFQIGIIGTITAVASIFFTLTIGKMSDRFDKRKMIFIGALLMIGIWIFNAGIAAFSGGEWMFYISSLLMAFLMKVFLVPYGSLMYNRARTQDAQFMVLREVPTVIGRVILFSSAILLHDNLPILFLLVGLSFVYFLFFKPKDITR